MTFFYDLNKKLAGLTSKQKLAEDGSWGMSEASDDSSQDSKFIEYVMSFYGPGGVYDMGATEQDVSKALAMYKEHPGTDFAADSFDREHVRDILIDKFGYEWPEKTVEEEAGLSRMKQLANIRETDAEDDDFGPDDVTPKRSGADWLPGETDSDDFSADDVIGEEVEDDDVPNAIHMLANQWWNATDDQPRIASKLRSLGYIIKQTDSEEEDEVELTDRNGQTFYISADTFDPDVFEAEVADKDYDKDGKKESPKAEVWGARARAAAIAGHPFSEDEQLDEAEADEHAVRELVLFADNDADLYRQSYEPIVKNLQKKVNKGVYDTELAKKLWSYHADRAAQKYAQDQGVKMPWFKMFSKATRALAAAQFEENAREEVGADELAETATDDAVAKFQDKQTADKMKRLSNPRDYFEAALNRDSMEADTDESDEDVMDYLNRELADYDSTSVNEDDGRPYVVVHARKGKTEVTANSSYEAAKKAAAKWGLKNTAGIDTYLADVTHTAVDENSISVASPSNPIKMFSVNGLAESSVAKKTKKKLMDPKKAIKHVVDPEQKKEVEKYQATGRLDPKKFKKKFLKTKFPEIDDAEKTDEQLSYTGEDAVSRQYNGNGSKNAYAGLTFEDETSSSGGSIAHKAGVTKHTAGGRYAAMGDEEDAPKVKKVKSGLGRGRPAKEKAPEYSKMNDPFGRVGTAPKGKKGTVVKGKATQDTIDEDAGHDAPQSPNYVQISKALDGLYAMLERDETMTAEEVLGHIAEAKAIWEGDDASFGGSDEISEHGGGMGKEHWQDVSDKKQYNKPWQQMKEHGGGIPNPTGKSWQSMKPSKRKWQTMKEADAKPDFLDLDKDGNKKEPMKNAAADSEQVNEKAVSKKQQKFMGMVHAAQKGEKPASKEVANAAKGMTKQAATDYASTKHKGLPEKVKEGDNVMKIDNTAGAKETQSEPGSNKPGMEFGGSIYENFDAQVESLIKKQINESISINVSQSIDDNGEPTNNVSVNASGDDAQKLAQILSLAGITGGVQPTVEPEAVEVVAQPELSFDVRDFCPVCDCAPCECDSECDDELAYELDEADVKVSDNEPDWPTNQETSDDALQYAGGLNKPKSTGQTTTPVIASQLDRQRSVSENIDLERSLFKTWKNYKG